MTQSHSLSFLEATANVLLGYVVSVSAQILIFPLFDIAIPLGDNLKIGAWFGVISLARSYLLRRLFNIGG